jgi:hypothetical protein
MGLSCRALRHSNALAWSADGKLLELQLADQVWIVGNPCDGWSAGNPVAPLIV